MRDPYAEVTYTPEDPVVDLDEITEPLALRLSRLGLSGHVKVAHPETEPDAVPEPDAEEDD